MAKQRKKVTAAELAKAFIGGLVKSHAKTFTKRQDKKHERVECMLDLLCAKGSKKVQSMVKKAGYQTA